MRAAYNNLIDDYTPTASSEDANYPATNVADTSLSKVWRATSCASEYVQVDSGSSITCTVVVVAGHNFSGSAVVVIRAGSTATIVGSAPSLSANVTYRSGIMLAYFTSSADRYWRLTVEDPNNTDGYVEIGRIFLGTYLQFDPASLSEFPVKHVRSDNVDFSITNQAYGEVGVEHLEVSYEYPRSSDTMKKAVEALWDECGKYKPFFFSNFDTQVTIIFPMYCLISDDLVFKFLSGSQWEYSISLREVN